MTHNQLIKNTQKLKGVSIVKVEENNQKDSVLVHVKLHKKESGICPHCGQHMPGYDAKTRARRWRGLDMGTHKVFIVADVKRIKCAEHGVVTEAVPWAFHGSKFTKKFEQQVAFQAIHQSKKLVCQLMRINWRTVGTIIARVQKVKEIDPDKKFENLEVIGVDETSYRKGHTYITTVVNQQTGEVVWAHDGFGKNTFEKFYERISEDCASQIRMVSGDGARWIKNTVNENSPQAEFCIDPYHVVTWAIDALDRMRRRIWREAYEQDKSLPKRKVGRPKKGTEPKEKESVTLKRSKYPLGKNPENLTEYQRESLNHIQKVFPKLFRGYQIKESLRAIFRSNEGVEEALKKWLSWASRCRIPEFVELSRKIRRHTQSILSTMKYGLSNARIEALNNKIKLIIRRSYGFQDVDSLIGMIMLVCSNVGRNLRPAYTADTDFE